MKIDFQASRAGRLERLVRERLPFVRRAFLQKLFRKREIRVGGSPRKSDAEVVVHESITIFLPDPRKNFSIITGCEILFEDAEIIAFNKTVGITTHKGVGTRGKTLREAAEELLDLKLTVVHRLDRETSGILIFAKTKETAQKLATEFRERRVKKIYHAVVSGILKDESGIIKLPLKKIGERMAVVRGGLSAETQWKLIRKFKNSSLVEINLITGRTHQIRVHFSAIGHSIVGDKLYGDSIDSTRMFLHASDLRILDYKFHAKLSREFLGT